MVFNTDCFADGKDTFDNIDARFQINHIFKTREEQVLALQTYGFMKYRYLNCGDRGLLDYQKFRRFCRDMSISECSFINDPTFNMVYHVVYGGAQSPADRYRDYCREGLGDGYYLIQEGEFEPVFEKLSHMFFSETSVLKELYHRAMRYYNEQC